MVKACRVDDRGRLKPRKVVDWVRDRRMLFLTRSGSAFGKLFDIRKKDMSIHASGRSFVNMEGSISKTGRVRQQYEPGCRTDDETIHE